MTDAQQDNPLLETGRAVPAFDRIKPGHFMPAFDAALEKATQRLDAIKNDTRPPDFQNTFVALESAMDEINDVLEVLSYFYGNFRNDQIADLLVETSQKHSDFTKSIQQDPALIARIKPVYDARESLNLDEDDKALLQKQYQEFESSGGFIDEAKHPGGRQRIKDIDNRLIELCNDYNDNLMRDATRQAVWVRDEAELAGVSPEDKESFAATAKEKGLPGGWLIMPERLMVDSLLEHASVSAFRQKILEALDRMGTGQPNPDPPPYPAGEALPADKDPNCDNHPLLKEIHDLRQEYAVLLDYPNYATFARSRTATPDLAYVRDTLDTLVTKIGAKFEADMRDLEAFVKTQPGAPAKLEPWDITYWAAQQKKALYDFDASAFSQYLELDNVMKGLFYQADKLFGLEFRETAPGKYPVPDKDIRTYDVFNKKTGQQIGIMVGDFYSRAGSKDGGAWMTELQAAHGFRPCIIGVNVNATKPVPGSPTYLSLGDYETVYHEWGHMLQGFLGTNAKYDSQHGTAGPADFTEIHSTMNEPRATSRETLTSIFTRNQAGQPPPADVIDNLIRAKNHFKAWDSLRMLQNSLRDLEYHTEQNYVSDRAVEDAVKLNIPHAAFLQPRPLTRFDHLFGGPHDGYAAGYNNYVLAEIRAAAAYEPFAENGPFDPAWAARLQTFYGRGSGGDNLKTLRDYLGHDPTLEPYLHKVGVATPAPSV